VLATAAVLVAAEAQPVVATTMASAGASRLMRIEITSVLLRVIVAGPTLRNGRMRWEQPATHLALGDIPSRGRAAIAAASAAASRAVQPEKARTPATASTATAAAIRVFPVSRRVADSVQLR
jgi:hypothetical protein